MPFVLETFFIDLCLHCKKHFRYEPTRCSHFLISFKGLCNNNELLKMKCEKQMFLKLMPYSSPCFKVLITHCIFAVYLSPFWNYGQLFHCDRWECVLCHWVTDTSHHVNMELLGDCASALAVTEDDCSCTLPHIVASSPGYNRCIQTVM